MKLRISSAANAVITEIALKLRTERSFAARRFVDAIDRSLKQVATFPGLGVNRSDLAPGWRAIILRPFAHLLFYVAEADAVVVTRVIDGRRDLKAIVNGE